MTELRVTVPDDVAERLASEAAERGTTAEDIAADLLRSHVPVARERRFPIIGMFDVKTDVSVAEAERMLEDGEDDGYPP